MIPIYWSAFIVFLILFAMVTVLGFSASRWHRGDLDLIEEWGLAGRRFGTFVTWFLLGGDLYTAYTFIAVPALVYGAGAFAFFAVPYTIVVFPIMYIVMPRLWRVSKQRNYVTAADFVRGRFNSPLLALAVAITGILATMPYIALQLTGIQAVLAAMGLSGHGFLKDLPLVIAFLILAAYTYTSGLRAPALTAILKDILIYVTVIVACIAIPIHLGGYGHIFQVAAAKLPATKGSVILAPKLFTAFSTLALGSAFALLPYPHAVTGTLGAKSGKTIQRNAALLPLYSLALTFIAILGYMAIAAGIHTKDTSLVVPLLFLKTLPTWFAGFAFGAIAIGALVPAAIMAIAAANLFTRNIYREYFASDNGPNREAQIAKIVGLIVILGALFFIVAIPLQYSIYFQTLGGIWILQTVPTIIFGLYTRWFHRWALFLGWLVGMIIGTGMAAAESFKTSIYPLHIGHSVYLAYAGVWAIIVNIVIVVVLSVLFNALNISNGTDDTQEQDYVSEPGEAVGQ